jgi:hypothetical protein
MSVLHRLAMYTTVFLGVENYLAEWYRSVEKQTDRDFDLYIGCDQLRPCEVETITGNNICANWVVAPDGSNPVQVRELAIREILKEGYSAVIFVDSDDILHPTRVEAARESVMRASVGGCALEIVTETGAAAGWRFGPVGAVDFDELLPRCNCFGMSNTVYRTDVLRQCLPVPPGCRLMDWFLITRAWAVGAPLEFDTTCRMYYRQHSSSLARVLPPFSTEYVRRATGLVLLHYISVLAGIPELSEKARKNLVAAKNRVEIFAKSVTENREKVTDYVGALNRLEPSRTWWTCVAHPDLEDSWRI